MKLWKYQGTILSEFPHPHIKHLTLLDHVSFNPAPFSMLDQWFMFYACDPRDPCSLRFIQDRYRLTTGITRLTGTSFRKHPPTLDLITVSDRSDLANKTLGNIRYGQLIDSQEFEVDDIMNPSVWSRTPYSQSDIRAWSTQGCDSGHTFDRVMNRFCEQHLGDRNWIIHLKDVNKCLKLNVMSKQPPEAVIETTLAGGLKAVRKLFRRLWQNPVIPADAAPYDKTQYK